MIEFRMLGPLEVLSAGQPLDLGWRKQRVLLAVLLVNANRTVSRDALVDEVWEGAAPPDGVAAVRVQVARLRKTLAVVAAAPAQLVVGDRLGYQLHIEPEQLDARRFEQLTNEARAELSAGHARVAADKLRGALALWRGPVLADLASAPFVQAEANRLGELRLTAVELLMDARLALGEHQELVPEIETLTTEHPLHERFWGQRMVALYRSGRQADALSAYQDLRNILGERLGIKPSPELARLELAVLLQNPELDWRSAPVAGASGSAISGGTAGESPPRRENLPVELTSFVGRQFERAEVVSLLGDTQLLTLTGPPGSGKSRLALRAAKELDPPPPGGVWWVDLGGVSEPELVVPAVASVIGVREEAGRILTDKLVDAVATRELLIVVDNCEHLRSACAELISTLLERSAVLRILVTSRQALGCDGEKAWPVSPMSLPKSPALALPALRQSEAVELFVRRATAARPDFSIDAGNARVVAEICIRLDGLPLGIELAAARAGALSPRQVLAGLDDRFRLLRDDATAGRGRGRSLQAALDWSYELLAEDERALLRRLSVFPAGWTLPAAGEVCGGTEEEVRSGLARLVAKSLVVAETDDGEPRYRLLETVHHYATQKLRTAGEHGVFSERQARWGAGLAEGSEAAAAGGSPRDLRRLEAERANLRAGFEWAVAHRDVELALRLAGSLILFWRARGHFSEALGCLERAATLGGGKPGRLWAKALWGRALLAGMVGDFDTARASAEQSLAVATTKGDAQLRGRCLLVLGNSWLYTAHTERAVQLLEESVGLARASSDGWCLSYALVNLGEALERTGQLDQARSVYEESVREARAADNLGGVVFALTTLGRLLLNRGEYRDAEVVLDDALIRSRELADAYSEATLLSLCGALALGRGHYDAARAQLRQSLQLARDFGSPIHGVVNPLVGLGRLALAEGDPATARQRFQEILDVGTAAGAPLTEGLALVGLGEVCQALGDHAEGEKYLQRALELLQPGGGKPWLAWAHHQLGEAARSRGKHAKARSLHGQALLARREINHLPGVVESLESLARLAATRREFVAATSLFAKAQSLRDANGYARAPSRQAAYEADLAVARDGCGPEEFASAWGEGIQRSLEDAVKLATG